MLFKFASIRASTRFPLDRARRPDASADPLCRSHAPLRSAALGQLEREGRALTQHAFYREISAHGAGQVTTDRETKSRSFRRPRVARIDADERREDPLELRDGDSAAA